MKFSNIFPAQTVPYTDCFNTIASQKKKIHISEYVSEIFLEVLVFLCFEKLSQPVILLKMLLFHRHFSVIFLCFSKFFQSISTSHFSTIQIDACFYTPNERCSFLTQQLVVTLIPLVVIK